MWLHASVRRKALTRAVQSPGAVLWLRHCVPPASVSGRPFRLRARIPCFASSSPPLPEGGRPWLPAASARRRSSSPCRESALRHDPACAGPTSTMLGSALIPRFDHQQQFFGLDIVSHLPQYLDDLSAHGSVHRALHLH